MKNKKITHYVFMLVSLFVLIISSLPHHHHEGVICFHTATESCEGWEDMCSHSHHDPASSHSVERCVVDFEVISSSQENDLTPVFDQIVMLWEKTGIESLFVFQKEIADCNSFYIESLHGTLLAHAVPLRAPPFFC